MSVGRPIIGVGGISKRKSVLPDSQIYARWQVVK